ncbi:MAG: hypothetical protein ACLFTT_13285 [Candidatus Hydrogenedentota bacterium]
MAADGSRIVRSLFLRMVVVGIIAGAAAVVFTLRLPDSYRARALLIQAPMPFDDEAAPVTQVDFYGEDPTPRPNWLRVGYLESLPMPDYQMILMSDELVAEVRDHIEALHEERGAEISLTMEKVKRSMEVNTKIFMQTYEEVEYQRVIELLLSGHEPEIVGKAANFWAERSIALANEMRFVAKEGALEHLDEQIAYTEAMLEAERAAIAGVTREHRPESLERRLGKFEAELTALQLERNDLEVMVASLEEASGSPEEGELPGTRRALKDVRARIERLSAEIGTLRPALAEVETALALHKHKVKYYETQLEELAMSQYATRLQSDDISPEFKFVSRALPPQEKSGPWRSLIVVVAVFLAVLAVPVHFFTMHALRRYACQLEQAQ